MQACNDKQPCREPTLSPVHTKNDNYKDNDISVHTSGRYRLYILSACASVALNSPARYSRVDSDLAVNVCIVHQLEKNRSESDSNQIISLCLYRYSCGVYSAIL